MALSASRASSRPRPSQRVQSKIVAPLETHHPDLRSTQRPHRHRAAAVTSKVPPKQRARLRRVALLEIGRPDHHRQNNLRGAHNPHRHRAAMWSSQSPSYRVRSRFVAPLDTIRIPALRRHNDLHDEQGPRRHRAAMSSSKVRPGRRRPWPPSAAKVGPQGLARRQSYRHRDNSPKRRQTNRRQRGQDSPCRNVSGSRASRRRQQRMARISQG